MKDSLDSRRNRVNRKRKRKKKKRGRESEIVSPNKEWCRNGHGPLSVESTITVNFLRIQSRFTLKDPGLFATKLSSPDTRRVNLNNLS